jgi:hypothetical protein
MQNDILPEEKGTNFKPFRKFCLNFKLNLSFQKLKYSSDIYSFLLLAAAGGSSLILLVEEAVSAYLWKQIGLTCHCMEADWSYL